jgi:hypothetical protein
MIWTRLYFEHRIPVFHEVSAHFEFMTRHSGLIVPLRSVGSGGRGRRDSNVSAWTMWNVCVATRCVGLG